MLEIAFSPTFWVKTRDAVALDLRKDYSINKKHRCALWLAACN
jgi:hypothetical protein